MGDEDDPGGLGWERSNAGRLEGPDLLTTHSKNTFAKKLKYHQVEHATKQRTLISLFIVCQILCNYNKRRPPVLLKLFEKVQKKLIVRKEGEGEKRKGAGFKFEQLDT